MGKLSMCRICVAENVRMHVVTDGNLHDVYQKLTDVPFITGDKRPMVACYLCYVKLKQCYRLMKQCVQAEEVFTRMLSETQEENNSTKKQDEKYFSELTVTEVIHVSIDGEVWPIDSIKQEFMEQELDMCETQDDGEQTKKDSYDNALEVQSKNGSHPNQEYLVPLRDEECSLDDEPLMFFKSEDEEVVDVSEKEQRAVKKGTPAAKKPKLDIRGATLRDIITDTQTRHGISVPEIHHTNENSTSYTEPKVFTCVVCQSKFNYKTNLLRHIVAHNLVKPYKCDICQRGFSDRSNLKRHAGTHTNKNSYKCEICERVFVQPDVFKRHIRTHTSEKPFKCDVCQRGFSDRSNLKRHAEMHNRQNSYKCEICERVFAARSRLKAHVRTHTGEKPYKCDICQRGFVQHGSYMVHIRLHTGFKP